MKGSHVRRFFVFLALLWSSMAMAQDARRIVEPLDPAIIDNAAIVDVSVKAAPTAEAAIAKFDKAAAKKASRQRPSATAAASTAGGNSAGVGRPDYSALPFAQMFPKVMQDIAEEFHLTGSRRISLAVTIDTVKLPNGMMAIIASSSEQIAGMVEVRDADDGRPLGLYHIDVINEVGGAFGLEAVAHGPSREFLAREFSREAVRVLAGRKSRDKPAAG
jgi:hypothetical protein